MRTTAPQPEGGRGPPPNSRATTLRWSSRDAARVANPGTPCSTRGGRDRLHELSSVWICAGRPSADPPPPKGGARARGDERARLAAPEEGAVWLGSAMPWRWEPPPREAAARAALLQPGGLTPRAACPSPPPRARAAARARAAPT
ncbi:unnamed protein product, partial [Prorocentrum cordatum]